MWYTMLDVHWGCLLFVIAESKVSPKWGGEARLTRRTASSHHQAGKVSDSLSSVPLKREGCGNHLKTTQHCSRYHIAGNFRWCKFSHIWPKSPQNKFSYVLISHARATRPHPCSSPMAYSTAWQYCSRFIASVSIVRLIKSLWIVCSRIWHSIAKLSVS